MPRRVAPDSAIALGELLARLPEDRTVMFAGDGLPLHGPAIVERLGARAMLAPANLCDLRADAACALAAARPEAWMPAGELHPVYLRAPAGGARAKCKAEPGGEFMSEITVGLMTEADVEAVHAIEVACFPVPWSKAAFYREVTENACARYVVVR